MKKMAVLQTVVYGGQVIFEGIENDAKYIGRILILFYVVYYTIVDLSFLSIQL